MLLGTRTLYSRKIKSLFYNASPFRTIVFFPLTIFTPFSAKKLLFYFAITFALFFFYFRQSLERKTYEARVPNDISVYVNSENRMKMRRHNNQITRETCWICLYMKIEFYKLFLNLNYILETKFVSYNLN